MSAHSGLGKKRAAIYIPPLPLRLRGVKVVPDAFSHGYPPQPNHIKRADERNFAKNSAEQKNVWNFYTKCEENSIN